MGGRLALHLCDAWVDREELCLQRAILIGASPGIEDDEERALRLASDQRWSVPLWRGRALSEFLQEWNAQPLLAVLDRVNPNESARLFSHRREHKPEGLAAAFDILGQGQMPPLHDRLDQITLPVLWVAGSADTKYAEIARWASERCPNGEMLLIEGKGHAPHLEDVERFSDLLCAMEY